MLAREPGTRGKEIEMKPSCSDIATDFDLWGEYIDPHATMTEDEFNNLSLDDRLSMMHEAFPDECDCEQAGEYFHG